MISASHNPYDDNGIKFFDASGSKLSDELEEAHRGGSWSGRADRRNPGASAARRASTNALDQYQDFCASTLPAGMDLTG